MRQGRNVLDALHVHARSRERGDRTLAATTRTADSNLEVLDAELRSLLGSLLGGTLPRERSALATALEAAGATACPTERIATRIGNRDRCVVEAGVDVGDSSRNAFLLGFSDLGHG